MAVHAGGDRGAEGPPQPEGAPLCHWCVIMMRELLSVPPARNLAPAFLFLASSQASFCVPRSRHVRGRDGIPHEQDGQHRTCAQ